MNENYRQHRCGTVSDDCPRDKLATETFCSRRRFLLLSTTALATIVVACCPRAIGPIDRETAGRSPARRLPTGNPTTGEEDLPLCIDVHCHIFNGQDIDIAGFVRGPVASDVKPAMRDFLRSLADVAAEVIYDLAPSGVTEAAALNEPLPTEGGLEGVTMAPANAARQRDQELSSTLAERLAERLRGTDIKEKYLQLRQSGSGLESAPAPAETGDFSPQQLERIFSRSQKDLEEGLEGAAPAIDPDGGFRLIKRLTARRSDNAFWLADTYSKDLPRVTLFMPALVDFDHWLGCPGTRTSVADQVIVTEKIAIASADGLPALWQRVGRSSGELAWLVERS